MKVLIASDNPELRQMIKRFIRDIADEIEECAESEKILAAYGLFLPDWILLDIEMKKSGGFGTAQQVKQSFPNAAIVFLASFDDANLRTIANEIGAKGFVLKENLSILREVIA
jgi:DNA-binding NarL/FixJ family response regulator